MNANELIETLSALTEDQKKFQVCAHDGGNPSDSVEVKGLEIGIHWLTYEPVIHIIS